MPTTSHCRGAKQTPEGTSRSAKNDMFSSRYGMRKGKHGLRCGQCDDAPCHRFGTGYGGCRFTAANTRRSFSRSSTPKRKAPRFHDIATAKKSGCGPNCKYSRCAANDPCYAVHFYNPNERQDRRGTKKIGPLPSPSLLRNTCSRMAQIREISQRVGENITMGLKYLQEVQDQRNLDVLTMFGLSCDGNCADRSDRANRLMSRESIRGGAGRGDEIPGRISSHDTGLKTKTVAINTERSSYEAPEFHEPPTRTLKDMNSNSSTLERLNKQTSPIPIDIKTSTPTPIPRVALLRPPRPPPPQNITKKDQQMIRYALQQQEWVMTPQPKYGRVVPPPPRHEASPPPPPIPLHGHAAPSTPGPRATPLPTLKALHGHEAPHQPTPEIPPFHSLTSRREGTTPVRLHPLRERWLPGKISPRLRTPPLVNMTYPSKAPSISPKSQSTQHQTLNPTSNPNPKSPPKSFSESPQSHETSPPPASTKSCQEITPQAISPLTSNYDSDITTTTTDSNPTSEIPTVCLCILCGKSQNASAMMTGVYKNNNNPLYNLASPLQSPGRNPVTMGSNPLCTWWFTLEVLVLLILGGLVTLGLMSFVDNVFGAYLAENCGCGNGVGKGPQLVTDGLKSGIVNWVTCPMVSMDESWVQLTPVR